MKHICHRAVETARTLVLHCDWVACDGCGPDKKWMIKGVDIESRYLPSQTLSTLRRSGDEREDLEADEPDEDELGCWSRVSCAGAKRENHGDDDS